MQLVKVTYEQCRLEFFEEQLAAAQRKLDWAVKHNPDPYAAAEKGEAVAFYEWAVEMARKEVAADNNVGSKWIPVTERLPSIHEDVLMYFKDDDNMVAGYLDDVDEDSSMWSAYSDGGYCTDCDYVPTHWMSLPEAPKEVV